MRSPRDRPTVSQARTSIEVLRVRDARFHLRGPNAGGVPGIAYYDPGGKQKRMASRFGHHDRR